MEIHRQYELRSEAYREYQDRTYSKRQEAADGIASRCAVMGAPAEAIGACLADEIEAYQQQDSAEKDLKAQQDMAFWALITAAVGGGSLVLSFGGLVMLWRSLRQTREAINNDREVGHAQVRAYISVLPADFVTRVSMPLEKAVFKIKNSGQSPAIKVNYSAALFVDAHPRADPNPPHIIPADAVIKGTSIPAGGDIEGEAETYETVSFDEYTAALSDGSLAIYLYVVVEYEHVFEGKCSTIFLAILNKDRQKHVDATSGSLTFVHDGWHTANHLNEVS